MAFDDLEQKRIEKALNAFIEEMRPVSHIRPELDYGYEILDQSVVLVEIRPQWDDASIIHRHPFAKATFIRARSVWKIFWLRQTLKWHGYEPVPIVSSIEQFLEVVKTDRHGCFFG